mgnify:CR=1 FL=1|tara:strand:- start:1340 stop:2029 length:690 start_codon:yes stop_codon:yes gene_type:complete
MGKNLHKGYYGQYSGNSKFSKRHDEDYDAKEAYNKNLTASARLHYLENLRHDHDSPAKNKVEGMTHAELAEFSQNRPMPASGKTGYERHMEMHKSEKSGLNHINEFMDENHQHNKNHDERPMHSHKNYKPKKKAAPKMSALPAHGDEFREKAKAASKGEQGDYDYDDPKVVALLDKAKKADAEHQKEQPDAAVKMSALFQKFDRKAEDIERRQRERLEKEAAKKKQKNK